MFLVFLHQTVTLTCDFIINLIAIVALRCQGKIVQQIFVESTE